MFLLRWTILGVSALMFPLAALEPAPTPDPKQVDTLVSKLCAESWASREEATAELRKLNGVLDALKASRKNACDAEQQMRLDALIAWHSPLKAVVRETQLKGVEILPNQRNMGGNPYLQFDGTPSIAANFNQKLKFTWKQIEGETLSVHDSYLSRGNFVVRPNKAGKFRFQLVVSDERRTSEPVFVDVHVDPAPKEKEGKDEEANAKPAAVRIIKPKAAASVTIEVKEEVKKEEPKK